MYGTQKSDPTHTRIVATRMKILAIRSIPLGTETREGWNGVGVRFVRRHRSDTEIQGVIDRYGYDSAINLGDRGFRSATTPVWNELETVLSVMAPERLRQTLDGFGMAARRIDMPHWHKTLGWGGSGVRFHDSRLSAAEAGQPCELVGEVQEHIEGDEFRVITVGNRVVQASRKVNCEWNNGRHYFDYEWCGVNGIRNNGAIPLLKRAVEMVPGYVHSVLGWDIIVDDRPYIIECNTSPGINEATARRIVAAMEAATNVGEVG